MQKKSKRFGSFWGHIEFAGFLNRKTYNKDEYKIGHGGATVLKTDTHKLMQLVGDDINLDKSIRSLLLDSVQSKLGNVLRNEREVVNNISYAQTLL